MTRAQHRRARVFSRPVSVCFRSQICCTAFRAEPPRTAALATTNNGILGERRPKYPALILLQERQNNSLGITLLQIAGIKIRRITLLQKKGGEGWLAHFACQTPARETPQMKRWHLVAQGAPVYGGPGASAQSAAEIFGGMTSRACIFPPLIQARTRSM